MNPTEKVSVYVFAQVMKMSGSSSLTGMLN